MWLHPDVQTLPDIVRYWGEHNPTKPAIVAGPQTMTYAELNAASDQFASALLARGLQGRNVGYLGKNYPEFWEVWFGAGKAGSPLVPLNWRCAPPELAELVADARLGVIITEPDLESLLRTALGQVEHPPEVVVFEPVSTGAPAWLRGTGRRRARSTCAWSAKTSR